VADATRARAHTPFAPRSVSLRLYPHDDRSAAGIVEEMRDQAALAAEHGFDGVMTSEHHGGFAGYVPNPLQAAGWCLEAMATGWAAPCPLLLPLRPVALVAEEIAWLAARFPGRVGIGVASGALAVDFDIMDTTMDDLTPRFAGALTRLAAMLDGSVAGPLSGDPAIRALADVPVPLVSAAMGPGAVRRAAALGAGVLFDSLSSPSRCRTLSDAYRAAGGTGPCMMVRRVWLGSPPTDRLEEQLDRYRGYAAASAQAHWTGDEVIHTDDPGALADSIAATMRAAGADALNVRLHAPGVPSDAVREQVVAIGDDVLPRLREELANG
jgi:alkanesulfonate monooxygenase SsuD/methylene tetrahydromethanopterin reductase-like flavin-dependent oxidoreductase (luciferase family)